MLDFGFYNMDCMEGMKEFPDGYFELAIVDPPYGDASENEGGVLESIWSEIRPIQRSTGCKDGRNMGREILKKIISWDVAPGKEYFNELFRISRNQIIWGGTTLIYHLPDVF